MVRSVSNITVQLRSLVGKEVWFRNSSDDFCSGTIEWIEGGDHASIRLATVNGKRESGWRHVHANDIFLTREDLISANYEKFQAQVKVYCNEINTIEDLVKFCYTHRVAEYKGYTDWAASSAARKAAMKILGIEIDSEAAEMECRLENGEDVPDEFWKK